MATYNTKQKEKLLSFLKENPTRSYTVDDIVQVLKQKGDAIGKTTVYRHMESLNKTGDVRRSLPEDGGSVLYQYVPDTSACGHHFHVQCIVCGELYHVDCEMFDEMCAHMAQDHGIIIDARRSVLRGVCARCRKEEPSC